MQVSDLKLWITIQVARWRRELIFLMGGLLTGLVAAGFAKLADLSSLGFRSIESRWPYAPLLLTPLGFAVSIYLTLRLFPGAQGSGIPQAIAAREIQDQPRRAALVSIRIAIGKIILTALGLLCGASIGREGPTVQVGASLMYATGRMSPLRQPGLIVAGASAGVAAAFNAPLAGVVFGIEELAKSFEMKTSGLIIATVIMAGLTSQAILGDYTYFGTAHVGLGHIADWLAVPVCGVIGGLDGRRLQPHPHRRAERLSRHGRPLDQGPSRRLRGPLRLRRRALRARRRRQHLRHRLCPGARLAGRDHAAARELRRC